MTAEAGTGAGTEALVARLFEANLGALDLLSIHVGDQLGFYRALADDGPATTVELAARTGTHERYAREWLEQQAATAILTVDESSADPSARRYALSQPMLTSYWTRTTSTTPSPRHSPVPWWPPPGPCPPSSKPSDRVEACPGAPTGQG